MTTNWTDLPTLVSVCNAQTDGWEIECTGEALWFPWDGRCWDKLMKYRGRPRQPKMKKVNMLCWFDGFGLFWRNEFMNYDKQWIRIPAEDKTIEIPEGV